MSRRPLLCAALALLATLLPAGAGSAPQAFHDRCTQAQAGSGALRILHFGDSHLAGAGGASAFAQFFRERFPGGGGGFGLPWVHPRPGLRARSSPGWRISDRTGAVPRLSLAGGQMETQRAGAWASLEGVFTRVRLYGLETPGGGKLSVRVDGVLRGELELQGAAEGPRLLQLDLPTEPQARSPRTLELRCTRAGRCLLLGVAVEGPAGAVYSPIAFNGARAAWLLDVPESAFQAQLAGERPDLVILSFGTNEASTRGFSPEAYQRSLEGLIARFRKAAPEALVLLAGPPDAQLRKGEVDALARVIGVQQALAQRLGLRFIDQRQAMGGAGSIEAWAQQGLALQDRVHFTPQGYGRLSEAVLRSLFPDAAGFHLAAASPRPAGVPRAPELPKERWLYFLREADGSLTITDDPSRASGRILEKKERLH